MTKKKTPSISPYAFPGLKLSENDKRKIRYRLRLFKYRLTKDDILAIISEECGVTIQEIIMRSRKKEVVNARFMFCGIMKIYFGYSLQSIGDIIDGRDHTSVIHAITTFGNRFETEEWFRDTVKGIYEKIGINPDHFKSLEKLK
jgi:chromosomal replication initiation ATPase DnaA